MTIKVKYLVEQTLDTDDYREELENRSAELGKSVRDLTDSEIIETIKDSIESPGPVVDYCKVQEIGKIDDTPASPERKAAPRFLVLEDWNNGCDNASGELFATFPHRGDAEATLIGYARSMVESNSIGDDFRRPAGDETVRVWSGPDIDGSLIIKAWIGTKDTPFLSSEFRREFIVVEETPENPRWDFANEEEDHSADDIREPVFSGIVTNGRNFLYYRTSDNGDGTQTCHIHNSIRLTEDTEECSYLWTPENDSVLLSVLNHLEDSEDFCGEGSPIRTIKFQDFRTSQERKGA